MHDGGCVTDVPGIRIGHYQRRSANWRTGTTVVLLPPGATAGVDVRGGGPGTRETDLLQPTATITTAHAICLTGGSAYGLAAAGGVMRFLEERRIGFSVGPEPHAVVPLVPAAVIFDLGRGGTFAHRPDEAFGYRAAKAARSTPAANGAMGAGTGARAHGLQGGVGTCSTTLPNGVVVAAVAVVNAVGSVINPSTGLPWESGSAALRRPSTSDRKALQAHLDAATPPLNTTIGVVTTTARLSKAECSKFAGVAHDGLARAVRPVHSLLDGDTIFGIATGRDEVDRTNTRALNALLEAGAQCFAAACTNAIVFAEATGSDPSYRDLCPTAFPRGFPSGR